LHAGTAGIRHVAVIIDSAKQASESNAGNNTSATNATCKAGKG
jgi:hypothetical protein